jgi:hypothetical protein
VSNEKKDADREAAAAELKALVQREKGNSEPASLDDLIELLDADDLRNVVGMSRPKGSGGSKAPRS